jgi:hypothetical protein
MCEINVRCKTLFFFTLSTFAKYRQVGYHERLVRTVYGMSILMKIH